MVSFTPRKWRSAPTAPIQSAPIGDDSVEIDSQTSGTHVLRFGRGKVAGQEVNDGERLSRTSSLARLRRSLCGAVEKRFDLGHFIGRQRAMLQSAAKVCDLCGRAKPWDGHRIRRSRPELGQRALGQSAATAGQRFADRAQLADMSVGNLPILEVSLPATLIAPDFMGAKGCVGVVFAAKNTNRQRRTDRGG